MSSTQFKAQNGVLSQGELTIKTINSGDLSTSDKILVVDTNGNVQFVTSNVIATVTSVSQTAEDGFINSIIFG